MVLSKEDIVRQVAQKSNTSIKETRKVCNAFEEVIFENLQNTTQSNDIVIKLFKGISLEGKFHKETTSTHPKTREKIIIPEKIWAKAKITRNYNRKLNNKNT